MYHIQHYLEKLETHSYFPVSCFASDLSNGTAKFSPPLRLVYFTISCAETVSSNCQVLFHAVQHNSNYAVVVDR